MSNEHDDDCFLSGGDDGRFPCICKRATPSPAPSDTLERREAIETLTKFAERLKACPEDTPDIAYASIEASHGEVRAIRAAILALAPSTDTLDDWRDITTAPKDGTGILVVDMNASDPGAGMAWFINGEWCGDDPEVPRGADDCTSRWPSPTHWMPLPNLPNLGGRTLKRREVIIMAMDKLYSATKMIGGPTFGQYADAIVAALAARNTGGSHD